MKHYKVDGQTDLKVDDWVFHNKQWTQIYLFHEDKGMHTSHGWICRTELYESEPVPTREQHQMTVTRYRDLDGNPTCATNFNTGDVCPFYRTQKFGCHETCMFAKKAGHEGYTQIISRRGKDGLGSLIPLTNCPVWADVEKD